MRHTQSPLEQLKIGMLFTHALLCVVLGSIIDYSFVYWCWSWEGPLMMLLIIEPVHITPHMLTFMYTHISGMRYRQPCFQ